MNIINLDIYIKRIINKIKIVEINEIYHILDNSKRFHVDIDYYKHAPLPINQLIVGILDDETIEGKKDILENDNVEDFPKDTSSKYLSIVCYPNIKKVDNYEFDNIYKLIKYNNGIFYLIFIKKDKVESNDEQEIGLFLFTLQYYNYILETYNKYNWIENMPAVLKINDNYFLYMLKIKKNDMDVFYNECKNLNYNFNDIIIEKYQFNNKNQLETLAKYIDINPTLIFERYL